MRTKMYLCIEKFFSLGIFIIIIVNCAVSQCVEKTPCSCVKEDGEGYDLRSLTQQGPIINGQHNVKFQPCKDVNLNFNQSKPNESLCNSSSICLLGLKNESISLGSKEDTTWEVPITKNEEPQLIFRHSGYETKIKLICCHTCASALRLNESKNKTYALSFESPKNCLVTMRSRGLSTGSVLVILLFVFSALYLIGGAVALRIFRGAVGLELVPNYDFWCDLPALVRDGVTFTLSGCSAGSYESI